MSTENVADALGGAADLIEENGWWDGNVPPEGHCVVTGLRMWAMSGSEDRNSLIFGAMRFIARQIDAPIPVWNDNQPDGETVVKHLRYWADQWEAEQR